MPFFTHFFTHFDSEDDYHTGCWNVSHCQQQQSHSGLRSPGQSNSTYFWNDSWVETFHSEISELTMHRSKMGIQWGQGTRSRFPCKNTASDKQRGKASPDKNKHRESLQITKKGPAWRAKKQAPTFPLADYIWNKKARVGHYIVHSQAEWRLSNFTIHVDSINQYTDR